MFHWLHHLFNPHCTECRSERQEESICQTCEVLTVQLARSNVEKDQLLAQIERMANPPVPDEVSVETPEPLKPRVVPWAVRKGMLEAEDRVAAQLLRNSKEENKVTPIPTLGSQPELYKDKQPIEDLEKEVGIDNANQK